ncbi:MAG: COG4280 domain-containing protein [Acidimicrobiales bacterium]
MTSTIILALAVFGASSVEMVEAFTIVLAAGVSRGWRSAIEGTAAAVVTLAVIVVAVGIPLVHLVPLNALRVVVGGLLLVLGLNWLRKAILRSSGHKALHDEDAIYAKTVSELSGGQGRPEAAGGAPGRASWRTGPRDATGFVVAFKGVFLEGLEVVMIVLTLGSSSGHLGLAAVAAGAAVVVVGTAGALVARQLSEVPENALKMGVGIMLSSFGVFWVGEGAGIRWPGSDLFLLALVAIFVASTALLVQAMRQALPAAVASPAVPEPAHK